MMYDLLMADKEYLNNNNFKILNINLPNQFFCMVILPVKCGGGDDTRWNISGN